MTQQSKNIAIIGSGLVGSLLAIYLKKLGIPLRSLTEGPISEISLSLVDP